MPSKTGWYIEGRIIHHRYWGVVTIEEAVQGRERAEGFFAGANCSIHVLIDLSGIEALTFSLPDMIRHRILSSHPGGGWVIAYGVENSPLRQFYKFLGVTLQHVLRRHIRVEDNWEAARTALLEIDHTLSAEMLPPAIANDQ